jgi:hypothetical protein
MVDNPGPALDSQDEDMREAPAMGVLATDALPDVLRRQVAGIRRHSGVEALVEPTPEELETMTPEALREFYQRSLAAIDGLQTEIQALRYDVHSLGREAEPVRLQIMYKMMGPTATPKSEAELLMDYEKVPMEQREVFFGRYLGQLDSHKARLREVVSTGDRSELEQVSTFPPEPGVQAGGATAGAGPGNSVLRPRMPNLPSFTGVGKDRLAGLRTLVTWVGSAEEAASLTGMEPALQVRWAAQHFEGSARSWWQSNGDAIKTFPQLLMGLSVEFVGPNPFDLLVGDLRLRGLRSFGSFATFRSWFVQTVAAMRVFGAENDRMWGDNVLVDTLVDAVLGTHYHEGVVVDAQTKKRPTTLARALEVLDERHRDLLGKLLAWGQVVSSDGAPKRRAEDAAAQAPQPKLSRHRQHNSMVAARVPVHGAGGGRGNGSRGGGGGRGIGGRGGGRGVNGGGRGRAPLDPVDRLMPHTRNVTRDQALARYNAGQCVQCGGTGHGLSTCPRRSSN